MYNLCIIYIIYKIKLIILVVTHICVKIAINNQWQLIGDSIPQKPLYGSEMKKEAFTEEKEKHNEISIIYSWGSKQYEKSSLWPVLTKLGFYDSRIIDLSQHTVSYTTGNNRRE